MPMSFTRLQEFNASVKTISEKIPSLPAALSFSNPGAASFNPTSTVAEFAKIIKSMATIIDEFAELKTDPATKNLIKQFTQRFAKLANNRKTYDIAARKTEVDKLKYIENFFKEFNPAVNVFFEAYNQCNSSVYKAINAAPAPRKAPAPVAAKASVKPVTPVDDVEKNIKKIFEKVGGIIERLAKTVELGILNQSLRSIGTTWIYMQEVTNMLLQPKYKANDATRKWAERFNKGYAEVHAFLDTSPDSLSIVVKAGSLILVPFYKMIQAYLANIKDLPINKQLLGTLEKSINLIINQISAGVETLTVSSAATKPRSASLDNAIFSLFEKIKESNRLIETKLAKSLNTHENKDFKFDGEIIAIITSLKSILKDLAKIALPIGNSAAKSDFAEFTVKVDAQIQVILDDFKVKGEAANQFLIYKNPSKHIIRKREEIFPKLFHDFSKAFQAGFSELPINDDQKEALEKLIANNSQMSVTVYKAELKNKSVIWASDISFFDKKINAVLPTQTQESNDSNLSQNLNN